MLSVGTSTCLRLYGRDLLRHAVNHAVSVDYCICIDVVISDDCVVDNGLASSAFVLRSMHRHYLVG